MTPINVTYKVTDRISIERDGGTICIMDSTSLSDIILDLNEAWAIGTHLRDICDDHLVAGGWIAMSPNPYELDRLDYDRDS